MAAFAPMPGHGRVVDALAEIEGDDPRPAEHPGDAIETRADEKLDRLLCAVYPQRVAQDS